MCIKIVQCYCILRGPCERALTTSLDDMSLTKHNTSRHNRSKTSFLKVWNKRWFPQKIIFILEKKFKTSFGKLILSYVIVNNCICDVSIYVFGCQQLQCGRNSYGYDVITTWLYDVIIYICDVIICICDVYVHLMSSSAYVTSMCICDVIMCICDVYVHVILWRHHLQPERHERVR